MKMRYFRREIGCIPIAGVKFYSDNGSITTAETAELLDVKYRRARVILLNMVKDSYLRKKGAARSTIYVNM